MIISAMIVRFITKRFIGDYDPNAPKSYAFRYNVDNEEIFFQLIDGSGLPDVNYRFFDQAIWKDDFS